MHPYRIAGLVLGTLALFFVTFLVIGFLLPNGWEAERTLSIEAPVPEVFPFVARAQGWSDWTPTPETGLEFFGPEEGVGSGYRWDDPSYGLGEFVIQATTPPSEVRYAVSVEDDAIRIVGEIRLEVSGGETLVHWREEGDFGWNPLLGYMASRMNELQGTQMEQSLLALKQLVEARSSARIAPD